MSKRIDIRCTCGQGFRIRKELNRHIKEHKFGKNHMPRTTTRPRKTRAYIP